MPHDTPGLPRWQTWEDAYNSRIIGFTGAAIVGGTHEPGTLLDDSGNTVLEWNGITTDQDAVTVAFPINDIFAVSATVSDAEIQYASKAAGGNPARERDSLLESPTGLPAAIAYLTPE